MTNISKASDPRFRRRWGNSGAFGRLYPLPLPRDIDTNRHFWKSFDNREREISARWIVQLCQTFGSWRAFTREELELFYAKWHQDGFLFNGLDTMGYVRLGKDGQYRVTATFVSKCYHSSPGSNSLPEQCLAETVSR